MLTKCASFLRRHAIGVLISGAGLFATGATSTVWALYQARENRVEEMKAKALQDIAQENHKFRVLLDQFTYDLSQNNKIDLEKKKELASSLVSMYSSYGEYRSNLSHIDRAKIAELQASINDVKKQIQSAKSKSDLEHLGAALVSLFRSQKSIEDALERSVGRGS